MAKKKKKIRIVFGFFVFVGIFGSSVFVSAIGAIECTTHFAALSTCLRSTNCMCARAHIIPIRTLESSTKMLEHSAPIRSIAPLLRLGALEDCYSRACLSLIAPTCAQAHLRNQHHQTRGSKVYSFRFLVYCYFSLSVYFLFACLLSIICCY